MHRNSHLPKFFECHECMVPHIGHYLRIAFYLIAREPFYFSALHFMPRIARMSTGEEREIDVLVRARRVIEMPIEETGRNEVARAIWRAWIFSTLPYQLYIEPGLFFCLAERGLVWVFVEFYVSTGRQPNVQLFMFVQEQSILEYDIDTHRKIYFFVEVAHGYSIQ